MTYRIGTIGQRDTVHLFNTGTIANPRAVCGIRGKFVTIDRAATLRPDCHRCLTYAAARREREAADRKRGLI